MADFLISYKTYKVLKKEIRRLEKMVIDMDGTCKIIKKKFSREIAKNKAMGLVCTAALAPHTVAAGIYGLNHNFIFLGI